MFIWNLVVTNAWGDRALKQARSLPDSDDIGRYTGRSKIKNPRHRAGERLTGGGVSRGI